jgi:hypothetical protein
MSAELLAHEVAHRRTGSAVLGLVLGGYGFFALAISGSLSLDPPRKYSEVTAKGSDLVLA